MLWSSQMVPRAEWLCLPGLRHLLRSASPPCLSILGYRTKAVGIVVSESSVVRLFCHGQLVGEIIPELWMMDHAAHLRGTVRREQVGELTVLTPNLRQSSIV